MTKKHFTVGQWCVTVVTIPHFSCGIALMCGTVALTSASAETAQVEQQGLWRATEWFCDADDTLHAVNSFVLTSASSIMVNKYQHNV